MVEDGSPAWRERHFTVLHQLLLRDNAVALGTEPRVFVARELRVLGLTVRRLPGEYRVNFRNGGDASVGLDQRFKGPMAGVTFSF